MRILVVFTGGTIGCSPPNGQGVMSVMEGGSRKKTFEDFYLLTEYKKRNGSKYRDLSFDVIEPLQILSENITANEWETLISALRNIKYDDYKGIIITHGTDTTAYTSSLIGMLLAGIKIPVVFVGSNINLFYKKSDGHRNFSDAVDFIYRHDYCGTFVIFNSIVYLGTRIKQSKHFVDTYGSTNEKMFGVMLGGIFEPVANEARHDIYISRYVVHEPIINKVTKLNPCVLMIKPYIGLNYNAFCLNDAGIKAVLHETYHSSTACTSEKYDCHSILKFSEMCAENGIKLYASPFTGSLVSSANSPKYESTEKMMKGGIEPICDMSLESAYAKLIIAYNIFDNEVDIKEFLDKTIFFERI